MPSWVANGSMRASDTQVSPTLMAYGCFPVFSQFRRSSGSAGPPPVMNPSFASM